MAYVPLHCHSVASLLDGIIKPYELAQGASEMGFNAVGLSDHGSMSGCVKLHKAAKEFGIKPILGIEAYFVDNAAVMEKGETRYHVCLFAKTATGFKSLCKLMTAAHKRFYYKPRFDFDMLEGVEDVIVSTACESGLLSHPNYARLALLFQERFGDDFYLEIMPFGTEKQQIINSHAFELRDSAGIKIIATNDVHYLKASDSFVHNFLLKITTGGKMEFNVQDLYLRSEQEMKEAFKRYKEEIIQEALNNTQEFADKVDKEVIEQKDLTLPKLTSRNPNELLKEMAEERFEQTLFASNQIYRSRLDHELSIIFQKRFSAYFLLVAEITDWCRAQGMELGAGRGSAGGSLLCYVLGITDIDPIENKLVFERFLNPDRIDWPDIDLDIPKSKRHLVVQYLKDRFGDDKVSTLSTVSQLKTISAFKDVVREFGVPFYTANDIAKHLNNEMSLSEIVSVNSIVKGKMEQIENKDKVVALVDALSGTWRHSGKHAAGVVICPDRIEEFGIIEKRKDDFVLNWDMDDVGIFGLVKVDLLGLRSLDTIAEAKALIKERHGVTVYWKTTDVKSLEVAEAFVKGYTTGIFQFESDGMTHLVKQLGTINSKDALVDINALGRPGPLDSGMTNTYLKRYRGEESETPAYAAYTSEYTQETYGVIVYQEQIIKVLVEVAGYTPAQADTLRRIFAKVKGVAEFERDREPFVVGCNSHSGVPADIASRLFNDLVTFGRYGFNKSHAAAYTELALRQMWLKLNYPLEYMAALYKTTEEEEKLQRFGDECHRLDIPIKAPHINKSERGIKIDGNGLLIGLDSVKGLGDKSIEHILEKRTKPFESLQDFRVRLLQRQVNRTVLKNLVLSGAFDSFGVNHRAFMSMQADIADFQKIKRAIDWDALYSQEDDFTAEEKEKHKSLLMAGVYKMDLKPEVGLTLDHLRLANLKDVIKDCDWCVLRKAYDCPVAFEYTPSSKLFVLAEAPGKDEVIKGKPLIGAAGKEMEKAFKEYQISREELFLANVHCCRPHENKLPTDPPEDCYDILFHLLSIVKPKLIVAMGATPLRFMTGQKGGITKLSGKIVVEIIRGELVIPVLYCVHPASLLYPDAADKKTLFYDAIEKAAEIYYETR